MDELKFGYRRGLPNEGVKAAWGARWIAHQTGGVDFVYDRQDMIGDDPAARVELLSWLRSIGDKPLKEAEFLLKDYRLSTRDNKEVVLYQDVDGRVIGNPQASSGYLYVCAYLYRHVR